MNNKEILDVVGQEFIRMVRDQALSQFHNMTTREANSEKRQFFLQKYSHLAPEAKDFCQQLAAKMVDMTLHYMFWAIEQSDECDLVYSDRKISLKEISDGLCGELYTEEGWIERFSKYPPSIF